MEDKYAEQGYRRPPLGTDIAERLELLTVWSDEYERRFRANFQWSPSSPTRGCSPSGACAPCSPRARRRSSSPRRRRSLSLTGTYTSRAQRSSGRGRSPSPSGSTADAEEQWRKDVEKEMKGQVEPSEWDKQMTVIENYWKPHGFRAPAAGTKLLDREQAFNAWLSFNPEVFRQYGPGPNFDELEDKIINNPSAGKLDEIKELEEEAAKLGYSFPPHATSYADRVRLLGQWSRNRSSGQQDGSGSYGGNPYGARQKSPPRPSRRYSRSPRRQSPPSSYGMGGPSGYQ